MNVTVPAEPFEDPYTYPGTGVLRNLLGIRDKDELNEAEYRLTWARRQQLYRQPIQGSFDLAHLQAIHRHLFQDLLDWAGELRTVNISKADSDFHPADAWASRPGARSSGCGSAR